ncbi:hypothetical protein ACLOJK_024281 [Asimina triloba]
MLRSVRSRRRAQLLWDKLRKYVMYTWGPNNLDGENKYSAKEHSILRSIRGFGSLRKKTPSTSGSININRSTNSTVETKVIPGSSQMEMVEKCSAQGNEKLETDFSDSEGIHLTWNNNRLLKLVGATSTKRQVGGLLTLFL